MYLIWESRNISLNCELYCLVLIGRSHLTGIDFPLCNECLLKKKHSLLRYD